MRPSLADLDEDDEVWLEKNGYSTIHFQREMLIRQKIVVTILLTSTKKNDMPQCHQSCRLLLN